MYHLNLQQPSKSINMDKHTTHPNRHSEHATRIKASQIDQFLIGPYGNFNYETLDILSNKSFYLANQGIHECKNKIGQQKQNWLYKISCILLGMHLKQIYMLHTNHEKSAYRSSILCHVTTRRQGRSDTAMAQPGSRGICRQG